MLVLLKRLLKSFIGLFMILYAMHFTVGFTILQNHTCSLKGKYFICLKTKPEDIKMGDLVVFDHHLSPIPVIKQVTGLSDDPITTTDDSVLINQQKLPRFVTTARDLLRQTRVPEAHAFVTGDNAGSFDSRYQDFGFVPLKTITHKAWRIW